MVPSLALGTNTIKLTVISREKEKPRMETYVGAKHSNTDSSATPPGLIKFDMTVFTLMIFEGRARGADWHRWIRALALSAL